MPLGRAKLDFHIQQEPTDKAVGLGPLTQPNSDAFSAWLTLVF
jgi:hypothetical protein